MYCNNSDVRRRTPSISVLDVPDSVYSVYVLEAQDIIDSYLSEFYVVPFDPVPIAIKQMCADIAAYFAMRDYPDKIFEDDLTRIETSYMRCIDDLQSGKMVLPGATEVSTGTNSPYTYKVRSHKHHHHDINHYLHHVYGCGHT